MALFSAGHAEAQETTRYVRVARVVIDSARVDAYRQALKEEIDAAVKKEPGVLALYAVAEKEHPTHLTIFEIYDSEADYKTHLETDHFKKFKNGTREMVRSLELLDMVPIVLASK